MIIMGKRTQVVSSYWNDLGTLGFSNIYKNIYKVSLSYMILLYFITIKHF